MGWKASLVIVQHPEPLVLEEELLRQLGFPNVTFSGDTTLDECIYPRDKSLNIGFYNGCLIVADDYSLRKPSTYRRKLTVWLITSGFFRSFIRIARYFQWLATVALIPTCIRS